MFDKLKNMLSLDQWIKNFEGYLDARIDLVKFDVKEMLVSVLGKAVIFTGVSIFALAGLVCFNFGIAHMLNDLLGKQYAGFLILAVFYFLIALVIFWMRNHKGINQKLELSFREILKHPLPESNPNEDEPTS